MTEWPHSDARLVDAANRLEVTGHQLRERIDTTREAIGGLPDGLVFLLMSSDVESVVRYLSIWNSEGRAVLLLDPETSWEDLSTLTQAYRPAAVVGPAGAPPRGWKPATVPDLGRHWIHTGDNVPKHNASLALLLTTSGSTGSPKLVRLSRAAIEANTDAIIEVLGIEPDHVAITSLPLHYSYGLSVLNTHLAAGATVVLERNGLVQRAFWNAVEAHGVTTLSAVPYQFELMRRLRISPSTHHSLRRVTQAGGRLAIDRVSEFHAMLSAVGGKFFVMYGQTEAGPRITTLPPEHLGEKLGSVGPSLPRGALSIRSDDGVDATEADVRGEVIYRGPNVMMGYAQGAADLSRGDDSGGVLATGDIGHLDSDTFLYITGRKARTGKVFGLRVNLDDVESMFPGLGSGIAVLSANDRLVIWVERRYEEQAKELVAQVARRLRIHRTGVRVRTVEALPILASGKVDVRSLEQRDA